MFDVYVINMVKDVEKRAKVIKEFEKHGISKYTIIDGIYGKGLSDKEIQNVTSMICHHTCTQSSIGCAMSHMMTWKKVVESNRPSIIFEDDILLEENFINDLQKYYAKVPQDYDIIYLGCNTCDYDNEYSITRVFSDLIFPKKDFKRLNENVYIPSHPLGLHSYLISPRGAKKLLKLINGNIKTHVDIQINFNANDLNLYAIEPKLAYAKTEIESSSNTLIYPVTLNKSLSKYHDRFKVPYSYYTSVTYAKILGLELNIFVTLVLLLTIVIKIFGIDATYFIMAFFIFNIVELLMNFKNLKTIVKIAIATVLITSI